jgi:sigma-E factor negative regulatory protein RseA
MRAVFDGMRKDASLRREWDTYCLIGDACAATRAGSSDFVARVMASLEDEPTVLAPRARRRR